MSNSNDPNASGSGATSPTGPGQKQPSGDKQPSEADFITRQQEEARAAIDNVVTGMKRALAESADIRQWTRSYPWVTTAGAVVAGFFAGMALTPPKEESAKEFFEKKWESMKDRFAPAAESETAQAAADKGTAKGKSASAMGVILREVLKAVGPTLGGLITGAVAGQQAQDTAEHAAGNGHGAAAGGGEAQSTYPPPT